MLFQKRWKKDISCADGNHRKWDAVLFPKQASVAWTPYVYLAVHQGLLHKFVSAQGTPLG